MLRFVRGFIFNKNVRCAENQILLSWLETYNSIILSTCVWPKGGSRGITIALRLLFINSAPFGCSKVSVKASNEANGAAITQQTHCGQQGFLETAEKNQ